MYMDETLAELHEQTLNTKETECALCGVKLQREYNPHVELIGPVCLSCEEKMKSRSVYKCLFCRSTGFVEEETPLHQVPEVVVTVSCPFCHEPINRIPI